MDTALRRAIFEVVLPHQAAMVRVEVTVGDRSFGSLWWTLRCVCALCPGAGQIVFMMLNIADLCCTSSVLLGAFVFIASDNPKTDNRIDASVVLRVPRDGRG